MITTKEKITALRALMAKNGVDAYFIPHADEHQNEYGPPHTERLSYLTGFTGSAGFAVVLKDRAAVFVDGRYTIQAKQQLDASLYEQEDYTKKHPIDWIVEALGQDAVVGIDPNVVTMAQGMSFQEKLAAKSIKLHSIEGHLVDKIWNAQPQAPSSDIYAFTEDFSGQSHKDKIESIAKQVEKKHQAEFLCISSLESLAWLSNLRASDIKTVPVFLAYGLLDSSNARLSIYTNLSRLPDSVKKAREDITFYPYEDFFDALKVQAKGKSVLADASENSLRVLNALDAVGAKIVKAANPIILAKACKNEVEQNNIKKAHVLDGQALCRYFHWFDQHKNKGTLDELSVEEDLYNFRARSNVFQGISFDPISGYGSNGAVVHYRATKQSSRKIEGDGLYLLDSGGQYLYGTTDLTRVVAVGSPSQEMKEHYTLVLKGHIAMAQAVFPEGTTGANLDILARKPLWDRGLDYAHGTGHGVGMFLSVHEGPAGLSPRATEPLRAGMILSNEPGYYKTGEYGIRIENLVLVKPTGQTCEDGRMQLCFETISFVPFDQSLIVKDMLSNDEVDWINAYHAQVAEHTLSDAKGDVSLENWIKAATKPL